MKFEVSVIIPVFNTERYVEKAISSVLEQPEVVEVVIVNDGSTDNSFQIITKLQAKDSRIKVYHHPNNVNKGRSASRNLGIKKASSKYVAFLDSDDFYLKNRFENDKKVFSEDSSIDGVYNAIGAHFYRASKEFERVALKLTTISEKLKPEELFEELLYYKKGHFSIDGLTLKKSIFDKVEFFNETLLVDEDTHMFLKMALKTKLIGGLLDKPVAMRGVHEANVFNNANLYNKAKVYELLVFWSCKNNISLKRIDALLGKYWMFKLQEGKGVVKYFGCWFYIFFSNKKILFSSLSTKYFPMILLSKRVFSFFYKKIKKN
ncbi:glycosyltransferase family 2 protein [uncultured Algibacter sp.]|uniref:glycosyltransferase family 2 protein n=1 Tax=uncultured Algibacter sp. TaxID=298659 RepID=UPI002623F74B|nr:glycosyltransferase family 2 protein [uncultured Algibacter sp.]